MKEQLLRLGQRAITYGIGSVLNRFISFLLLPLFTRFLTPSDYGINSILGWMVFLITPVFSLGMGAAMAPLYFDKDDPSRKETTVWSAFVILLASVFLLILTGLPFAKLWSQVAFQSSDYSHLIAITFCSTALSILSIPFLLYLQFEEKAKLYATFTILNTVVSVCANILLVAILRRGVQGLVEGNFISQATTLTLFSSYAFLKLKFKFRPQIQRELLRLGIPLIPSFLFVFILQQGNRYVLQLFSGLDQVGIYTIGYNLGVAMHVPVEALNSAWVPFFMSFMDRREDARILFGRIVTFYVFGFGVLSLLFYIFSRPAIMLLTQPSFYGASRVVGLAATAYFLSGLFSLFLPGLYFAKEVKYVALIQGASALLGLGINLLLIPRFHVVGAGVGLVSGYLCMVLGTWAWNVMHRSYYLQVRYEWNRILQWSAFYISYILILQWMPEYSLIGESLISVAALMPLPLVVYLLLNSWERQNLKDAFKQFLSNRHLRISS